MKSRCGARGKSERHRAEGYRRVPLQQQQQPDTGGDKQAQASSCSSLLSSSVRSWGVESFSADPDFENYPELGFKSDVARQSYSLAVVATGPFTSAFKDKGSPIFEEKPASGEDTPDEQANSNKGRLKHGVIERSGPRARLVVLGSSSFLDDIVLSIAQQTSDAHLANLQLVSNLADWALEDSSLLEIRSKEQFARSLTRLDDTARIMIEIGHFAWVILAVILIGFYTWNRRRRQVPILTPEPQERTMA